MAVTNLAKQAFPGDVKMVQDAYRDSTRSPHSYILVDLTQNADEKIRLVGNFASNTQPMTVYTSP